MAFLTKTEKRQIAEAIRNVETKTSGELVTVIARTSDQYLYIPSLWAALLALTVPAVALLLDLQIAIETIYAIQVICFVIAMVVFRLPPIVMRLIPRSVQQRRAHRLAQEQFFLQGLHHTDDRSGVLIFVSVAERYVEIIADKGINDVVEPGTWDSVVNQFVADVQDKNICIGFISAIDACGKILEKKLPASQINPNQLADHLIEL